MVETKTRSRGPEIGKAVATCLQHGEGTALSYYRLLNKSEAVHTRTAYYRAVRDSNDKPESELYYEPEEETETKEQDSVVPGPIAVQLNEHKRFTSPEWCPNRDNIYTTPTPPRSPDVFEFA